MAKQFIATTLMDGYVDGPHITEVQTGIANQGLYGPDDYVLDEGKKAEAQILTNNSVRVFDATFVIQGRRDVMAANAYADVTIANGEQGMYRNDIIVRKYEKDEMTEIENTSFDVIKGTPSSGVATDPEIPTGDIRTGATMHNMALYRVKLEGLNIVALEPMFKVLYNMADIKKELESLNGKLNMEKIIIVRNNKKSAFRHPQAYGLTPVTCPDLFFDNSEGLFSHSNGAIVCNQDAIIHAHAHFAVASSAHYYTIAINNLYSDSELFYSYATSVGGYSGQTSNYFKVKKGDVISLSFGLNNSFSIAAKDLHAELDVRLVCVL